jgi:hypothetical protein
MERLMDPTVTYLIHAVRNAAKARDWYHLNLLLDELTEAIAV